MNISDKMAGYELARESSEFNPAAHLQWTLLQKMTLVSVFQIPQIWKVVNSKRKYKRPKLGLQLSFMNIIFLSRFHQKR